MSNIITNPQYHNTLLLLQHYRTMVWALAAFPNELEQELERPIANLDVLLAMADSETALRNQRLQNKLESIRKSRLLLDRINDALTVLKHKPDNGETMYLLLYEAYVLPARKTHEEILVCLGISSRHYYRLRQKAINIISIRLWGTPTAEIDAWLRVVSQLETCA